MNNAERGSGYTVPTGRPYMLNELRSSLGSLNDQVRHLWEDAHPLEYDAVADGLHKAFRTASAMAPSRSYTGCPQHPNGALDPEAPEGWGRCLLCNERRRRGERSVPAAGGQRRLGYPVPEPPYTLEVLSGYMHRLNEQAYALDLNAPLEAFSQVADLLHEAFIVAREMSRPRNVSGCARHPGAPTDPEAPVGQNCLFCAGEQQRRRLADAPVTLPPVRRGERRGGRRRLPRPVFPQRPDVRRDDAPRRPAPDDAG